MFEWFQHMKYCIILLALFCGLNGYAQDEDDIARSINLTEVVVLADGMTFEEKNQGDRFCFNLQIKEKKNRTY